MPKILYALLTFSGHGQRPFGFACGFLNNIAFCEDFSLCIPDEQGEPFSSPQRGEKRIAGGEAQQTPGKVPPTFEPRRGDSESDFLQIPLFAIAPLGLLMVFRGFAALHPRLCAGRPFGARKKEVPSFCSFPEEKRHPYGSVTLNCPPKGGEERPMGVWILYFYSLVVSSR